MLPFIIAGFELAETLLVGAEAAEESLLFVRSSITAMRWGDKAVSYIQMWNDLSGKTPLKIDFQEGETFYLALLGSHLIARMKFTEHKGDDAALFANEAIHEAIAAAYQGTSSMMLSGIVSKFCTELGRILERSDYEVISLMQNALAAYPNGIQLGEPLYDYFVTEKHGISSEMKTLMELHQLDFREGEAIVTALKNKIGTDRIEDVLRGSSLHHPSKPKTGLQREFERTSSLLGLLLSAALAERGTHQQGIFISDGSSRMGISSVLISRERFVPSNPDPVFPNLIMNNDIVKMHSTLAAARAGYSYDPVLKRLVPLQEREGIEPGNQVSSKSVINDPSVVSGLVSTWMTSAGSKTVKKTANEIVQKLSQQWAKRKVEHK